MLAHTSLAVHRKSSLHAAACGLESSGTCMMHYAMSDASVPPVQGMQDIHDAYRWRTFILPLVLHLPY